MRWKIESFAERFWKKVKKTEGCWFWTGPLDENGRGHIQRGKAGEGLEGASRASWIVHFGPIPEGKWVLHHCDVGCCVRPDHLYLGTAKDNTRDMTVRRRHWLQGKGHLVMNENNAHAKLTWDSVEEIRKESNRSIRASVFAKKYGVVKETIFSVRKNKTWIKDSGPVQ